MKKQVGCVNVLGKYLSGRYPGLPSDPALATDNVYKVWNVCVRKTLNNIEFLAGTLFIS